MNSKVFQASWILLLITVIIGAAAGLTMIVSPQFFMASEIRGYVGQTWSSLESANPKLFSYFMHDIRLLGGTQFTFAVVVILIVIFSYRKLQKLGWYMCLISTIVIGAFNLGLNIPIGDAFVNIFLAVFLVVGLVALALGAKPILTSKAAQS